MFKFDEYPEIKKAFRRRNQLSNRFYKAERRIRPNDEESKRPATEAIEEWSLFDKKEFALIVYNTFKEKKPRLYHQFKDYFLEWDQAFPASWEECNQEQKLNLLGLVLEIGCGSYWLPDEYYDDKPIDGCIPPPSTHTKPWKFGMKY